MPAMTDVSSVRCEMIRACQKMNAAGLNVGSSGNLSVRIGEGFLVTPSGMAYADLQPGHIVAMDWDGRYYGDVLPTSEWRFHHAILRARPDVNVVLHSHAPNCTALACCHLDIPPVHYMIATAGGSVIRCAPYAPFGTAELSDLALAALENRNACLLANHGVIVTAESIAGALALLEEVENLARLTIVTRQIGGAVMLSDEEMAGALERFKTYGKQPDELRNIHVDAQNRIVPPPRGGDRLF